MPELPEVEVLALELQKHLQNKTISQVFLYRDDILKTPKEDFVSDLEGKTINRVSRRGKFLRMDLHDKRILWFHMGMTGQILWLGNLHRVEAHTHMILNFKGMKNILLFRDIRRFGGIFLTNEDSTSLPEGIRLLGPDPFSIPPEEFVRLFKKRQGCIKSLLLNQRILSGLGNIYADECLFGAGIDPRRRPYRLSSVKLEKLHRTILETLRKAIQYGGSSIDDFRHTDGSIGSYQKHHRVYGRWKNE